MTTKKKDLEIVCNLQWKSRPMGAGDKSNIVGIYDIPATTLNWDTFKSYLLKNSGTTGDDVRVSYVDADRKETVINSQADFQIALYFVRQQARMGEIITLVLDRVSDPRKGARPKRVKPSSDVQTQVDSDCEEQSPPEWFLKYMSKFKKEILEDVRRAVNTTVTAKIPQPSNAHLSRKPKSEKRSRKSSGLALAADLSNEKEIKKTLKLERKLETKLEKLEHKTLKIKAKKLALGRAGDADALRSHSKSRSIGIPLIDEDFLMDARPVNQMDSSIPHMIGGETYRQSWEVLNSGQVPWTTEQTELRYAWGSQALMPVDRRVSCPALKPGEKGTVSVFLNIPETPGNYECYWHFHHNGRRFGHWLGCHIIVDESPVKGHDYDIINIGDNYELLLPTHWTTHLKKDEKQMQEADGNKPGMEMDNMAAQMDAISGDLQKLELVEPNLRELSSASDSDNQSIVSIADSNTSAASSGQFVVVKMPEVEPELELQLGVTDQETSRNFDHFDAEKRNNVDLLSDSNNETKSDTNATIDSCEEAPTKDESDYAYIFYNGQKIPMLKKFLRPDYLATAEDASMSLLDAKSLQSTHSQTEPSNAGNLNKTSSSGFGSGSCCSMSKDDKPTNESNKRLFVFPQNCPGFEVVYPSLELELDAVNNETSFNNNLYCSHSNLYEAPPCSYAQDFPDCVSPPHSRGGTPCTQHRSPAEFYCQYERVLPHPAHSCGRNKPYDKMLNGAAILASSAMSTARNVINMVSRKEVGVWENGRWISTNPSSKREQGLRALEDMGFWDRNLNATLLARYEDDVSRVVADLLQSP